MKAALSILLITVSLSTWGQRIHPGNISARITSEETPSSIQEQLNLLSEDSPLYFHARNFEVNEKLENLQPEADGFYYRLQASDLDIRVFLEIDAIPAGDTLFTLNGDGRRREYVCSANLHQKEWSSALYTGELTLYYKNTSGNRPQIDILSYSLELSKTAQQTEDFGDSGPCQVNVNCSEGENYQKVKRSIVRILIKHGSAYTWCTGTLMNNSSYDCRPLLLTAEHCALKGSGFVSAADMSKWIFYFNYEGDGCEDPPSEFAMNFRSITGATLLARSDDGGGDQGSDFLLMELTSSFPSGLEPYFAGWNRVENGPEKGVVIHHPVGDVKKISTFTSPAVSDTYLNITPDTHWRVKWSQTANGHGVTERGSSGSALMDINGLMTGILTGGSASCSALNADDFFGKFSYSWTSNGSAKNRQLAPWLDPENTGNLVLSGANCGDKAPDDKDLPKVLYTLINGDEKTLFIKGGTSTALVEVQIFDTSGRLRYQIDEYAPLPDVSKEIEIGKLSRGLYFVRILSNNKPMVTKIVVTD